MCCTCHAHTMQCQQIVRFCLNCVCVTVPFGFVLHFIFILIFMCTLVNYHSFTVCVCGSTCTSVFKKKTNAFSIAENFVSTVKCWFASNVCGCECSQNLFCCCCCWPFSFVAFELVKATRSVRVALNHFYRQINKMMMSEINQNGLLWPFN